MAAIGLRRPKLNGHSQRLLMAEAVQKRSAKTDVGNDDLLERAVRDLFMASVAVPRQNAKGRVAALRIVRRA